MEFSLLSDEPVSAPEVDRLGTGRAARQLAALVHNSRGAAPFTLAVDAGWGMGKSSLMCLVRAELERREDVETVWFNAWSATGADALEGLIKTVLMKFDERLLRRTLHRLSEHGPLIRAALATLTVVASPFGLAGLVDRLWRELSVDPRARATMRDELHALATTWAEATAHRPGRLLVVFIDDLDRCAEDTVLAVCEAVKAYLDVPGLAFVIGCDRSALGPSGLLRDLSPAGSAFMEKIFQTSYRLPVPSEEDIRAYVRHCAERSGVRELLDDALVHLIADRSARNPRRIKRLINGFGLECSLNPVWAGFESEAVIRTLLLQYLYPEFYRILVASDALSSNAGQEFLEYYTARRVLSRWIAAESEVWRTTVAAVSGHRLDPPDRERPDDWDAVLGRLEEQLPTIYPSLARDRGFVGLVEEWLRVPQVDQLLAQLQRGGAAPVVTIGPDGEQPPAGGRRLEGGPRDEDRSDDRYQGIRMLWVDDHPANNLSYVRELEQFGAQVLLAEDSQNAERMFTRTRIDLLLSDFARGVDGDAGLDALARWRERGIFTGPAVFFTGRVTPARERRCRELGARIATNGAKLRHYIYSACVDIRQGPS
ncbi:response regulator [Streptomyces sp. MBT65]|uniref:P-loop NTPase fold protein n=1 Tax=Streptomyces sp. MBT65 TaxID=1488395 RepID=UPI00190A60B8|nr:P-loop NTPase fold protein [Streptomyces sp. MBT65]MBK3575237.1 response regulator [Streptomyces sp. MBT65]